MRWSPQSPVRSVPQSWLRLQVLRSLAEGPREVRTVPEEPVLRTVAEEPRARRTVSEELPEALCTADEARPEGLRTASEAARPAALRTAAEARPEALRTAAEAPEARRSAAAASEEAQRPDRRASSRMVDKEPLPQAPAVTRLLAADGRSSTGSCRFDAADDTSGVPPVSGRRGG